jgi:beta-lactamase class A
MEERPIIYESAARRRSRRTRSVLIAAAVAVIVIVALGVAAVWTLRDGAEQGAMASPSPQASAPSSSAPPSPDASGVRLARIADVEAHQGQAVRLRYRLVEGPSGTAVTLVIRDASGGRVKARRLADAEAGAWVTAEVPLDLEPGRYTYALRLGDAGAESADAVEPSADGSASAELRVLAPLPPGFPGKKAVAEAREWIRDRDGDVAFAVIDSNGETAGGYREHEPFQLASLSKAVLLVATLRADPTPDAATQATLTSMITESDNGAAYTIFGRVGAKGMKAVAKVAGMEDYRQGAGWVDTRSSAADEARLFSKIESLVPAAGRRLARDLLSSVTSMQRWGIPAAAGPEGWTSYFKGGWLGMDNKLMVQAAWLENGKKTWALAVMTDDNPTRSYGWDTEKGVTGLLLGQEPTPAYLATVLE